MGCEDEDGIEVQASPSARTTTHTSCYTSTIHRGGRVVVFDDNDNDGGDEVPWDKIKEGGFSVWVHVCSFLFLCFFAEVNGFITTSPQTLVLGTYFLQRWECVS